jgi:hypothetical protein
MSELTQDALVQVVRQYYPAGFPVEEDDYSQPLLAHQRTPEHQRWRLAWEQALHWEQWSALVEELPSSFPGGSVGVGTQPFASACLRCFVYRKKPLPSGETLITRIAGAVSVLAPLFIVYVTTQVYPSTTSPVGPGSQRPSRPRLAFEIPESFKTDARELTHLIESRLGSRPFPLELAAVPLPGIRVGFFNGERPPTLLEALFSDNLDNLP